MQLPPHTRLDAQHKRIQQQPMQQQLIQQQLIQQHRTAARQRQGSLVIECTIAVLLLTTCAIGLLKWTQSSAQLNRKANAHLAASLLADNAAVRLRQSTLNSAEVDASRVANQLSSPEGFLVTIDTNEFTTGTPRDGELGGVHFTIKVTANYAPAKITHAWILESVDAPPDDASTAAGGKNASTAPPVGSPRTAKANDLE